MADAFSRNSADKPKTSKKQIVTVCVLGVGLLVVAGYNFHFFQPRPVDAAPDVAAANGGDDGDGLANPEAANDTIEALAHDPTAKLLRGKEDPLAQLETPPANPFALASKWRSELIKVAPIVRAPVARTVAAAPRTTITGYDVEQIKIQGIFKNGAQGYAIVNGRPLGVGSVVAGARITAIETDRIVVHPLSYPEGLTVEITTHAH